jgi:hypothetical protein
MKSNEITTITVTFERQTDKAILVKDWEDNDHWIPKSLIEDLPDLTPLACVEIAIPEWFAFKEDLI